MTAEGNRPDYVEVRCVTAWEAAEIVDLYRAGGWWKESYDMAGVNPLIRGSFLFAVAVDRRTARAIGMGRVISDGVSDGYIQDLVVLPAYRKGGIGHRIVAALVEGCRSRGIGWIGLIAEPGTEGFYEALGFRPMPGHIPMLNAGGH